MKKNKPIITYVFSFMIPMIIIAAAYASLQVYPRGANTILVYDMKAELLAMYGYLSGGGPGYDTFFHNMSGSLGGGFIGTIAHDLSLFDLVYFFVPKENIPDIIYLVTIIKIGFCGLSMSVFLNERHSSQIGKLGIILLSTCYALMSYNIMYAMWLLWLDIVIALPLLALNLERIIQGQKSKGFILLFTLCMISDYYVTYMAVIALVMYFVFRVVEDGFCIKIVLHRILLFALHGIIGVGLSSFFIVPVLYNLLNSKLSQPSDKSHLLLIKNTLIEVLSSMMPTSYSTLDNAAPPNIYCGLVVVILALIWFAFGRKDLRARLAAFSVVLIYFLSFIYGPLDRAWHGFTDPRSFSVRYAFTYVFFMICFAARGIIRLHDHKDFQTVRLYRYICMMCVFYTFAELYFSGAYILSKLNIESRYGNRNEYLRYYRVMNALLEKADSDFDGDYYRVYKDFNYSAFDGALYGYDGLMVFDSNFNPSLLNFFGDMGIAVNGPKLEERGVTLPMASLLDMGYFISHSQVNNYYKLIDEDNHFYLYKNPWRFPFVIETGISDADIINGFSGNPFENMNIVFAELSGQAKEDIRVFEYQEYRRSDNETDNLSVGQDFKSASFEITPVISGEYWIYSEFIPEESNSEDTDNKNDQPTYNFSEIIINGEKTGNYRNDRFCYNSMLGYLEGGENYDISLVNSYSDVGETYIYRYDDKAFDDIYSGLTEHRFIISGIGKDGIVAEGYVDKESYLLISLPFEKGYTVNVDGVITPYTSYRDALMLIKVGEGDHVIKITYTPPWMFQGIVISIVFLIVFVLIFWGIKPLKNLLNIRETLT